MDELLKKIELMYPSVDIYAFETPNKIELANIKVPDTQRGEGVGTKIVKMLQDYARSVGKPIVLRPSPEKGKKKALERFYKKLGFVDNHGRNMDYTLSTTFGKTMHWKFKEWIESVGGLGIRYTHKDGRGLMNNQSLNYDKLDDDEHSDIEDAYLGLAQPPSFLHSQPDIMFVFTHEGEKKHRQLIRLLKKASKSGVVRQEVDISNYQIVWDSGDGQLGLKQI